MRISRRGWAAALLMIGCGSRTELPSPGLPDDGQTGRLEPPVDAAADMTVDHAADGGPDVVVAQEAAVGVGDAADAGNAYDATDAEDATEANDATDGTDAATANDAADANDAAIANDSGAAGDVRDAGDADDAEDAACAVTQPADYANWPVSDSPQGLVENADGTITDNGTGLTWMRGPAGEVDGGVELYVSSFAAAEAACPCPWRVPQRIELLSIVDYSLFYMALNPLFLAPPADTNTAWTATPFQPAASWWFVSLVEGEPSGPFDGFLAGQIRCVRGTTQAPAVRYTLQTSDAGVSEVVDNGTGLTWKQQSEPGAYNWEEASAHCGKPYRVPTISELQTLVDSSRSRPAIDTAFFGDTGSDIYWSASEVGYVYLEGYAWYVDFSAGSADYDTTYAGGTPYQVRCVR